MAEDMVTKEAAIAHGKACARNAAAITNLVWMAKIAQAMAEDTVVFESPEEMEAVVAAVPDLVKSTNPLSMNAEQIEIGLMLLGLGDQATAFHGLRSGAVVQTVDALVEHLAETAVPRDLTSADIEDDDDDDWT